MCIKVLTVYQRGHFGGETAMQSYKIYFNSKAGDTIIKEKKKEEKNREQRIESREENKGLIVLLGLLGLLDLLVQLVQWV
jgi:hypothetical protein